MSLPGRLLAFGVAAAILAAPLTAAACKGDRPSGNGWDEYTICAEHYPADAPRFDDYPVKPYAGPVAAVRLHGDPKARKYRTMLRKAAQEQRPNFAGHFIVASWGCGGGCIQSKIIDARTGTVFHPAGVEMDETVNIHDLLFDDGMLRYRPDSRLFVLIGIPEGDLKRRGISFFEWTGTSMKLLRRVTVPIRIDY